MTEQKNYYAKLLKHGKGKANSMYTMPSVPQIKKGEKLVLPYNKQARKEVTEGTAREIVK